MHSLQVELAVLLVDEAVQKPARIRPQQDAGVLCLSYQLSHVLEGLGAAVVGDGSS